MTSIINIEGIGQEYKKKLATAGIKTTEALILPLLSLANKFV